jgi:hypothetical protein
MQRGERELAFLRIAQLQRRQHLTYFEHRRRIRKAGARRGVTSVTRATSAHAEAQACVGGETWRCARACS